MTGISRKTLFLKEEIIEVIGFYGELTPLTSLSTQKVFAFSVTIEMVD